MRAHLILLIALILGLIHAVHAEACSVTHTEMMSGNGPLTISFSVALLGGGTGACCWDGDSCLGPNCRNIIDLSSTLTTTAGANPTNCEWKFVSTDVRGLLNTFSATDAGCSGKQALYGGSFFDDKSVSVEVELVSVTVGDPLTMFTVAATVEVQQDTEPPVWVPSPFVDCFDTAPLLDCAQQVYTCDGTGKRGSADGPTHGSMDTCSGVTQLIDQTSEQAFYDSSGSFMALSSSNTPSLSTTPNCRFKKYHKARERKAGRPSMDTRQIIAQLSNTWYAYEDTEPPVLTDAGGSNRIQCTKTLSGMYDLVESAAYNRVTASDNCFTPQKRPGFTGVGNHIDRSFVNGATTCNGVPTEITIKLNTEDACGWPSNEIVIVYDTSDTKPPSFSSMPAITGSPFPCGTDIDPTSSTMAPFHPTAVDDCGTAMTVTLTHEDTQSGCGGTTFTVTRVWTATDDCLNENTFTQMFDMTVSQPTISTNFPGNTQTVECGGLVAPTVTTSDPCGLPVVVTATPASFVSDVIVSAADCPPEALFTNVTTLTASNGCRMQAIAYTEVQQDTTAPVLSAVPASPTVECGADTSPASTGGPPTVSDNCRTSIALRDANGLDSAPSTDGCGLKTFERVWFAEDCAGNPASFTQTISEQDTMPPVIDASTLITLVECGGDTSVAALGTPTATDACLGASVTPMVLSTVAVPQMCFNNYERTWEARDCSDNPATHVQSITLQDTLDPTFDNSIDMTVYVYCTDPTDIGSTGTLTASDQCDPTVSVVTSDDTATGMCALDTITRTHTASDCSTHSIEFVQTIVQIDNVPPVIDLTSVPNLTIGCNEDSSTAATGFATASDGCGGPAMVELASETVELIPPCQLPQIRRNWTATDCSGNVAWHEQVVTLRNNLPPLLDIPADADVECSFPFSPEYTGQANATDQCTLVSLEPVVSFQDVRAAPFVCGEGQMDRHWKATNCRGLTATATQAIVFTDTLPPHFTREAEDGTLSCHDSTDPSSTGVPQAYDQCSGTVTAFVTSETFATDASCPPLGVLTRRWTIEDCVGLRDSYVQTLTVEDSERPSLSIPPDYVVSCSDALAFSPPNITGITTAVAGMGVANDECTAFSLTHVDSPITSRCRYTQSRTRTWTAEDCRGNRRVQVQTIRVFDTDPPTLKVALPPKTVECGDSVVPSGLVLAPAASTMATISSTTPSPALPAPAFVDTCDPDPIETFEDAVSSGCGSSGTILRTWTGTDVCGNAGTALETIFVVDTTPPVLAQPLDLSFECWTAAPPLTDPPAGSDVCDRELGEATPVDQLVAGGCGGMRVLNRTWTVTDECGLSTSTSHILTEVDTVKPHIEAPEPREVYCLDDTSPAALGNAVASDSCWAHPLPSVTSADRVVGLCGRTISVERDFTATDACGNEAVATQLIRTFDSVPPTLHVPLSVVLECDKDLVWHNDTSLIGAAWAWDDCNNAGSENITVTETLALSSDECARQYTRSFSAVDQCGNEAKGEQQILVVDRTPPSLTTISQRVECQGPILETFPQLLDSLPALHGITFSDQCQDAADLLVSFEVQLNSTVSTCEVDLIKRWTVRDCAGNEAVDGQLIRIVDSAAPAWTLPPATSMNVTCDAYFPALSAQEHVFAKADALLPFVLDAQDLCQPGSVVITFRDLVPLERLESDGSVRCSQEEQRFVREWTATDLCGNAATVQSSMRVLPLEPQEEEPSDDDGDGGEVGIEIVLPTPRPLPPPPVENDCTGILEDIVKATCEIDPTEVVITGDDEVIVITSGGDQIGTVKLKRGVGPTDSFLVLQPADLTVFQDRAFLSPVVSVTLFSPVGLEVQPKTDVEICLDVPDNVSEKDVCLGFTSESGEPLCEDRCVTRQRNRICGSSGHFTNFGVLLGGASDSDSVKRCSSSNPYITGSYWGDLLLVGGTIVGAILLSLVAIIVSFQRSVKELILGPEGTRINETRMRSRVQGTFEGATFD